MVIQYMYGNDYGSPELYGLIFIYFLDKSI